MAWKLPSKHLLKSSLYWCFLHMTLVKIIGLLAIYSTLYFIPIELEISTRVINKGFLFIFSIL
jgi:hypothetical protein